MWIDNPFDPWDEDAVAPHQKHICFGKGGGSAPPPAPTQQTVNQTNLPPYAEPYFTRLLERTEAESNRPYEAYPDQRLADFSPDTYGSFGNIRYIAGMGTPTQIGEASNIASAGGNYTPALPFNTPSAIDPMYAGGPTYTQAYMNPFVEEVLDRGQRRAIERYQEQQLDRDADFVERGAFSNVRRNVADEIARDNLNQNLQDIEAQALANAYDNAQQMFLSDAERKLGAQVDSERAAQQSLGMNLQAADQLANYGRLQQELGLQQADALGRIGALQEEKAQAGLDVGYTDFLNQRDYPRQQLNFYSGILRGMPISAGSEVTRYESPPSPLSTALGLGLGGLSLYKQFANLG